MTKKISFDDMNKVQQIRTMLKMHVTQSPEKSKIFFKTKKGQYAEHDQFIGITVPTLRKIAKPLQALPLTTLSVFLQSKINEERLFALIILVAQYKKHPEQQHMIYQFYRDHLSYVNNWNLVDASAHLIMGAYLYQKNRNPLLKLAKSPIMWERRIAIVATWYFIRNNDLECTFQIATRLLNDPHDLIHKAVGWMLREAGKRDKNKLIAFLDQHGNNMPRTSLRYSLEKMPVSLRKHYLAKTR